MDAIELNTNLKKMTDTKDDALAFSDHNQRTTGLTLGALADLVSSVIQEVVGNDISSQLNGSPITTSIISEIAMGDIFNRIITARRNGVGI